MVCLSSWAAVLVCTEVCALFSASHDNNVEKIMYVKEAGVRLPKCFPVVLEIQTYQLERTEEQRVFQTSHIAK